MMVDGYDRSDLSFLELVVIFHPFSLVLKRDWSSLGHMVVWR